VSESRQDAAHTVRRKAYFLAAQLSKQAFNREGIMRNMERMFFRGWRPDRLYPLAPDSKEKYEIRALAERAERSVSVLRPEPRQAAPVTLESNPLPSLLTDLLYCSCVWTKSVVEQLLAYQL